ncbi:hypothetical protein [Formosa sp. 4Alg 33]|uniref:hypothetical protein n=1 Tax=Formosa sp. 4Alg 33 TaxID=3382189 RepID=UPI003D9C1213
MIQLILSTLAEFGLIRRDYKHKNRINKKEKEDGITRPIQKYFMQPSALMLIAVLVIGSLSAILFFTYQSTSVFPEQTKKEISEMSERMKNWNENLGQYPADLNELIGHSPLRQDLKKKTLGIENMNLRYRKTEKDF